MDGACRCGASLRDATHIGAQRLEGRWVYPLANCPSCRTTVAGPLTLDLSDVTAAVRRLRRDAMLGSRRLRSAAIVWAREWLMSPGHDGECSTRAFVADHDASMTAVVSEAELTAVLVEAFRLAADERNTSDMDDARANGEVGYPEYAAWEDRPTFVRPCGASCRACLGYGIDIAPCLDEDWHTCRACGGTAEEAT